MKPKRKLTLSIMGIIVVISVLYWVFYTPNLADDEVAYVLAGGLTSRSAVVSFNTYRPAKVRVQVSTEAITFANSHYSAYTETIAENYNTSKVLLDSLQPDTQYYYRLEINDTIDAFEGYSGTFTTPKDGAFSYKVAFGSCMVTGSNSDIFEQIAREDPLLFISTGDLHYENINRNCEANFIQAYYRVFSSSAQSKLYRSTAFAYMWDDHDYGNNNSDASSACQQDAIAAYRDFIPHYPLAFQEDKAPISQTFSLGRVRFILTDLRSQKVKPEYDGCERTKVGTNFGSEAHMKWFQDQMLLAKDSGQVVVWLSGIPYINHEGGPNYDCDEDDDWGGFPEERQAIANFVKEHQIPISIICGDAHMVAMDDGSNSDYAEGGGAPIPVFHAAPIDRYGSYKGGPYSKGYRSRSGQYGTIEVEDNGGNEVCLTWTAKDKNGNVVQSNTEQELSYQFCLPISSDS
ncbi:alkaline phosphatase D family protein [Tunicatimonas pelagia]|uniref:alkaline phosphatase D family protein n=1 Tax=Tunicatimonas pelagia TaxID=931531 RepID=UPI002666BFBD|nr:alkaline phosphatase D family protein [Tunicatimonas pelagia]WKN41377.1 alkaline phosphatase D family protein [Tunicatimonas pelagia]